IREQQMMLGMLRQIDSLLTALEGAAGMTSRISAPADLFLDFFLHSRILDHALQNARPAHQNVVLLLFGHVVCRGGFFLGTLKISTIEVDIGGIQVDGAGAVMVGALLVDDAGGVQVLQRFAAELGQASAIVMTCSARLARLVLGTATAAA